MIMKRFTFIATALVALASCSDSEFVGDQSPDVGQNEQGAIVFNSGTKAITRATNFTGAAAAEKLKNKFVVGGFKGSTSVATTVVFDNYNVAYTANTANTTESNSKNWEYVGLQPNALATIPHESGDKQTIKYWDYSQAQYDFIAYSLGDGGATATAITPSTAKLSTGGAYTLTGTTAKLKTVHIADLKTVLKADYNKTVELSFRNLASKVRMAIYETVPGYSVKDVKFYTSDAAISGGSTSTTAALYASSSVLPTEGTYTVYFPNVNKTSGDEGFSDNNKAHVSFTAAPEAGTQANQTFGALTSNYVVKEKYEDKTSGEASKLYLGRTSNTCTYAGTTPYYQDVLPYENGTSLTLKVDYTLISTDGSGETIKVVGAKAVVPAIYAQWKPGYAYTYIFKISDNTNGWTSGIESSEVSGLHAITFDAVVENTLEDNNQETVTTVATPSITTYQHVPAVNASANNEYVAGTVYAMVMNGGTPYKDLKGTTTPSVKDPAKFYSLTGLTSPTEADVMNALNKQAKVDGTTIYGRNGLVLTAATIDNEIADEDIPGADGNLIAVDDGEASKLTVTSGTTYAYVYTVTQKTGEDTKKYEVIDTSEFVAGTTSVSDYFTESGGVYTAATGTYVSGTTYYAKYTENNGVYAVKVIKVQ